MLPAVRRAVASACAAQSALPKSVAVASAASAATNRRPLPHQRRHSSSSSSSSKPSSRASARQPVHGSDSKSESESKAENDEAAKADGAGGKPKRKPKAAAPAAPKFALPSVPGTPHMTSDFVGLSSFFSMHRPISITHGLPPNVTDETFARIFASTVLGSRGRGRSADVISTISRAVEGLEGPAAKVIMKEESDLEAGDVIRGIQLLPGGKTRIITLDAANSVPSLLPFHPPPAPGPEPAVSSTGNSAVEGTGEVEATSVRRYQAVFTVEETTDDEGRVSAVMHSPRIMRGARETTAATTTTTSTFLRRMAQRQLRMEAKRREILRAISVKRQKKLKMKKKKYRKLQKRLKLENRKLDRA